jgi:hypothetical protein
MWFSTLMAATNTSSGRTNVLFRNREFALRVCIIIDVDAIHGYLVLTVDLRSSCTSLVMIFALHACKRQHDLLCNLWKSEPSVIYRLDIFKTKPSTIVNFHF